MFHSAQRQDEHAPDQSGAMGVLRPCFTVLELMIVLTLLVAMTGLVMPSVLNRLGDSVSASSLRQIEAAASECRSQAQQEGRALRLVAKMRVAGTVGLYIERIGESEAVSTAFDDTTSDGFGTDSAIGLLDSFGTSAASPVYVLPAGFLFSRMLPLVDGGFFNDPSAADGDSVIGDGPDDDVRAGSFLGDLDARPLTLAVYLPDGTAIVERPLYLRTGEETYAIEINRWTGGVTSTRVRREDVNDFGEQGFGDNDFGRGDLDDGADRIGSDGRRGGGP